MQKKLLRIPLYILKKKTKTNDYDTSKVDMI